MIDYDKLLCSRIKGLKPSGIRKFFSVAAEMDDCISLGVGEPDFVTPWHVREAGIRSLEGGKTWYTANAGLPQLREAVCNYLERRLGLKYNVNETFITVGGSEGIDLCMRTVLESGDEVILPTPCFVAYDACIKMCGAKVVPLPARPENGFRITGDEVKNLITDRTKMLVMPFPNNPTGAIMRREDLEDIARVLRDTNIVVLSDEIYAELTYGGERHVSIAALDEDMRSRTVIVNGFSKAYAMTGWRLGYLCAPEPLIAQMLKLHQYAIMCAPTMSQYAAIAALNDCDDSVDAMVTEYNMRRRLIVDGFNKIGLTCHNPEGAFYAFPCIKSTGMTSQEFCEKLLYSKRVAVIPGDAFGDSGEGYVRASYSYSVSHIAEALRRIEEFVNELH